MPHESLDAPDNLPKETACQVALGQIEDEVPGMPDEAPVGLEEPLLEVVGATNVSPRHLCRLIFAAIGCSAVI